MKKDKGINALPISEAERMKKRASIQNPHLVKLIMSIVCCTMMSGAALDAANFSVTNVQDHGPGSLRQAMFDATSGDSITFTSTMMGTISLESPLPWINGDLLIEGPLLGNVIIDGNNQHQIFFANQGTISITHFTLTGGLSKGGDGGSASAGCGGGAAGLGGGIFVNSNAHVTLTDVSIIECGAQGGDGGGLTSIYTAGTGGGGGGGYNGGRGGNGGANFGLGGGGGGGGGFFSEGGNAMEGGGGGGGVTAEIDQQTLSGNAQSASGPQGGDGGTGFSGPAANGGVNGFPGSNANLLTGGGGGGGGGVTQSVLIGGNGGTGGAIGGGGGAGAGAKGGLGGTGGDFGGGGGGAGSIFAKSSARGGYGGFAGGGGGGAGGPVDYAGGHGARGGFGGGGGGGGPENFGGSGGADLGGNGGDNCGGGGGGAALGGGIFVRSNGTLTMVGGLLASNSVVGGLGGDNDNPGKNGKGKGRDIYVMKSAVVFLEGVFTAERRGFDIRGEGTVVMDSTSAEAPVETDEDNSLQIMTKDAWECSRNKN